MKSPEVEARGTKIFKRRGVLPGTNTDADAPTSSLPSVGKKKKGLVWQGGRLVREVLEDRMQLGKGRAFVEFNAAPTLGMGFGGEKVERGRAS